MSKKLPVVAIVGRANVGKSSLFNMLLGKKDAVVAREAGTTRDAVYRRLELDHTSFLLVDTAGLKRAEDDFEASIQEQITEATQTADLILVVVEAHTAISDEDRRVARQALKSGRATLLITNKVDQVKKYQADTDWRALGIKTIIETAATQKLGAAELLEHITSHLPIYGKSADRNLLKIALIGRPNAGKSQLFNSLANKQQALVADVAGTTRDVNRATIRFNSQAIELLDTAGIRRGGRVERGIEHFSVIRSLQAIEESNICLLVMDVAELSTALDQKLAGIIKEAGKGLIIVVSKWDALEEKTPYSRDQIAPRIAANFQFAPWAPLIFTSSITGQNVAKIFELALQIQTRRQTELKTSLLNRVLAENLAKHPPSGLKGRHPKPRYLVQDATNPPTFRLYGAHLEYLHWSWKRQLEKSLRSHADFIGTPLRFYMMNNARKSGKTTKFLPKVDTAP